MGSGLNDSNDLTVLVGLAEVCQGGGCLGRE